jgi:Fic family protein
MSHLATDSHHLHRRIRSEYLEMPGLSLTARQAQRLFGADEHTCVALLEDLVARGFLTRRGKEPAAFVIASSGR